MLKKYLILVCCFFFFITITIGFCKEAPIPTSGTWAGDCISFFISKEGSKLTAINSTLKESISSPDDSETEKINFSLIVTIKSSTFTVTTRITANIPIQNGKFTYKENHSNYHLSIKGKFKSANLATGTASFSEGSNSSTINWTAKPVPMSLNQSPEPDNEGFTHAFIGHSDTVWTIKPTPDFKKIVSGSYDKTIKIWDIETGNLLNTLTDHSKQIKALAISPDGQRMISSAEDKKIIVWDLISGQKLNTLKDSNEAYSLIFLRNGKQFASGMGNGDIKIWDTETGDLLGTYEGHRYAVRSMLVSKDETKLISGSNDFTIKIWDLASNSLLNTLNGHNSNIFKISLSPDGENLVSASFDKTIKIWNLESGNLINTLKGHTQAIISLAITPDSRHLVSGSWDNNIKIWDLNNGLLLKTIPHHSGGVCDIIITPDGKQFITGLGDGSIKFWDLKTE